MLDAGLGLDLAHLDAKGLWVIAYVGQTADFAPGGKSAVHNDDGNASVGRLLDLRSHRVGKKVGDDHRVGMACRRLLHKAGQVGLHVAGVLERRVLIFDAERLGGVVRAFLQWAEEGIEERARNHDDDWILRLGRRRKS